ncbi:MAG: hypothetical protein Q4B88_02850 [Moraxella sp.]|nr:hypothetical protein [Moraxella sp.]
MTLENNPNQLNAVCAFGLFANENQNKNIDFDKIDNELKLLSKECEQHILDEWDFDDE